MKYECLCTKDGQFVVAKPAGWRWSKRELEEFDRVTFEKNVVALSDDEVILANGVTTRLSKIDRVLVHSRYFEVEEAKSVLEREGYTIDKRAR